jgi:anti-anti-sigma regulatory factor
MRALSSISEIGDDTALGGAGTAAAQAPVTVLVRPVGRLEGERSAAFRRRIAVLSVVDGADLAVDLGAVPAMDAAAARSLADAASRLAHHAGRLTVRHSRCQPREALGALGISATGRACSPGTGTRGGERHG